MKFKLKDIAETASGVTFRSRLEPSLNGNVLVIQMKDLTDDEAVSTSDLTKIESKPPRAENMAQVGDLLFRSRGQKNTAAILNEAIDDAVISSPLIRIRVKTDKVIPEYLLWYINNESTQSYLSSNARGTIINMVNKQALDELEIFVPDIETQKKIATLYRLAKRERHIQEQLNKKRQNLINQTIMQAVSNQ